MLQLSRGYSVDIYSKYELAVKTPANLTIIYRLDERDFYTHLELNHGFSQTDLELIHDYIINMCGVVPCGVSYEEYQEELCSNLVVG